MAALDVAPEDLTRPPIPGAALLLFAVAALAGSAIVGFAAVVGARLSPALPVIGAVGLAAAPIVVLRPRLALGVLVATEVSAAGDVLVSLGVPGLGNGVLLLAIASTILAVRRGEARFTWSPVYLTLILFVAVRAITVLLAPDPGRALANVTDVARAMAFLVVVAVLASVPGGFEVAVKTALVVIGLLAGIAILQEFVVGNSFDFFGFSKVPKEGDIGAATARHSGPLKDANFWARAIALFLPLAISVWAAATGSLRKAQWLGVVMIVAAGVYLTGSRGGLLTVGVCVVVWMAFAGPRSRRLLAVVPTLAVVLLLLPGVGTRLSTLAEISQASDEAGDASLVLRVAVQRQGFQMFLDNPATGVGAANFRQVGTDYLRESGLTSGRELAPHNLYLEMAAESGIAGLASWLLFFGSACWLALRAYLLRVDARDSDRLVDRLLPVGVLAGLLGWAFASIFLHMAAIRILFVVIGLAVALDARARRLSTSSVRLPAPPLERIPLRRIAVMAGSGIAVFVLVAAALGARETTWRATARAIVAVPEDVGADGHDVSVSTRTVVKRTAAELAASDRVLDDAAAAAGIDPDDLELEVAASTTSSILTITVDTDDRRSAAIAAQSALESSEQAGELLGPRLQVVATDAPVRVRHAATYDPGSLTRALLASFAAGWSTAGVRWFRRRWADLSREAAVA